MHHNRIKIAFFVGSFRCGGTERYLVQLLEHIDRNRYIPIVMCFEKSGPFLAEVENLGIKVYVFPVKKSFLSISGTKSLIKAILFLMKQRIMLLHTLADWTHFFGVTAGTIARVPKIIVSQRNMGHWMVNKKLILATLIIYKYLANGIIVNSHEIKSLLIEKFKIKKRQIQVIHNGIALNSFCINSEIKLLDKRNEKTIIGFIGRLHKIKGFELLIDAAKKVIREHSRAVFLIVGDGPNEYEYKRKILKYGLENNFYFVGFQKDVISYILKMDFVVLSSQSEGFPNIILEAYACQKPVIATRVGGVPEIVIDGETGIIIRSGDVKGLTLAIRKLINDPSLKRRLGLAGRKRVEKYFKVEQMVDKHEKYFDSLFLE
jgi:glycosyltransferase involved in cell wall biosynthesis